MEVHNSFLVLTKKGHIDLLFLGDSITQMWNENSVWRRFYEPRHVANFGIGGDRTQHVLWRIQNGELDGIEPKVTVLMIGTNNLSSDTPDEIAQGIGAIVSELAAAPKTQDIYWAYFREPQSRRCERLKSVSEKMLLDNSTHVLSRIGKAFLSDDGSISRDVMPDSSSELERHRTRPDAWTTLWSMLDELKPLAAFERERHRADPVVGVPIYGRTDRTPCAGGDAIRKASSVREARCFSCRNQTVPLVASRSPAPAASRLTKMPSTGPSPDDDRPRVRSGRTKGVLTRWGAPRAYACRHSR